MTIIPMGGTGVPDPKRTTAEHTPPEWTQHGGFGRWFALTESQGYPFDENAQRAEGHVFVDHLLDRWIYLGTGGVGLGAVRRTNWSAGIATVSDRWACCVAGDGWHEVGDLMRRIGQRQPITHLAFENYPRNARILMHGPERMPHPIPAYWLTPLPESGPELLQIYGAGTWWWDDRGVLQVEGARMEIEPR